MARKVKNWSEMLEEIQFRRSFVYREGCKFVYDSGDLPDSLVGVAPGTVLALRRPHGITATQMPGKAEDWIVIGSGEGGSIPQIVDEDLDEVSTNAVQNKVIKEALDSKVSTVAQNYTDRQKENARTNIGAQENITTMQNVQPIVAALNDRAADVVPVTNEVKALGYKVLNPNQSFVSQVVDANTVYEIRDNFMAVENVIVNAQTVTLNTSILIGNKRYYCPVNAISILPSNTTNKAVYLNGTGFVLLEQVNNEYQILSPNCVFLEDKQVYPAIAHSAETTGTIDDVTTSYLLENVATISNNNYYYTAEITVGAGKVLTIPSGYVVLNSDATAILSSTTTYTNETENDVIVHIGLKHSNASVSYSIYETLPPNVTLKFNGGSISGILWGANTKINANGTVGFIKETGFLKGTWANSDFYVDWWSCKADSSDDTAILQGIANAISLNGKGNLIFPKEKVYGVAVYNYTKIGYSSPKVITFSNCNVDVNLNGCTIKYIYTGFSEEVTGWNTATGENETKVLTQSDFTGYVVINFIECPTSSIHDGEIIGDRLTHNYQAKTLRWDSNLSKYKWVSSTHEFGWAVRAQGGTFSMYNMNNHDFTGDALYLQNGATQKLNALVKNNELHHCRRQGISVGSAQNISIENNKIHNIGSYDGINGTSPMAGIDLEYEQAGDRIFDSIIINNNDFHDCGKSIGWATWSGQHGIYMELYDNIFERAPISGFGNIVESVDTLKYNRLSIDSSSVQDSSNVSNTLPANTTNVEFKRLSIEQVHGVIENSIFEDSYRVFCGNKSISFKGCKFKNIDGNGSPDGISFYEGVASLRKEINANFESCTIESSSIKVSAKSGSSITFTNCTVKEVNIINYEGTCHFLFINCKIENIGSYYADTLSLFEFINCEIKDTRAETGYPTSFNAKETVKYMGYGPSMSIFRNCVIDIALYNYNQLIKQRLLEFYDCVIKHFWRYIVTTNSSSDISQQVTFTNCKLGDIYCNISQRLVYNNCVDMFPIKTVVSTASNDSLHVLNALSVNNGNSNSFPFTVTFTVQEAGQYYFGVGFPLSFGSTLVSSDGTTFTKVGSITLSTREGVAELYQYWKSSEPITFEEGSLSKVITFSEN